MNAEIIKKKLLLYLDSHKFCMLDMPDKEWSDIIGSYSGFSSFSWAAEHGAFRGFSKNSLCITFGSIDGESHSYLGVVNSSRSIATTQSRIKIIFNKEIKPKSLTDFEENLFSHMFNNSVRRGERTWGKSFLISKEDHVGVVDFLVSHEDNLRVIDEILKKLTYKDKFVNDFSLQVNAIDLALSVFNADKSSAAKYLEIGPGFDDGHPLHLYEDNVVSRDFAEFPGFKLKSVSPTGKAVFEDGNGIMEIFLGNKNPLEELFGVDLIYHNKLNKNTVMVQYKMMEKDKKITIHIIGRMIKLKLKFPGWIITPQILSRRLANTG